MRAHSDILGGGGALLAVRSTPLAPPFQKTNTHTHARASQRSLAHDVAEHRDLAAPARARRAQLDVKDLRAVVHACARVRVCVTSNTCARLCARVRARARLCDVKDLRVNVIVCARACTFV